MATVWTAPQLLPAARGNSRHGI